MSDMNPVYYIGYPLADMIACEICITEGAVRQGNQRQNGVFKAATRRQNYTLHLKRFHDVTAENVKIRCTVCGRVSKMPSRTAWRDTETHHRRVHVVKAELQREVKALAKDIEAVVEPLPPQLLPSDHVAPGNLPIIQKVLKTQEQKGCQSNKSMIISAMGQLFNVFVETAADPQILHSTPKILPQQSRQLDGKKVIIKTQATRNKFLPLDAAQLSRIIPKARPPIKGAYKRSLISSPSSISPPKKFHPSIC